MSEQILLQGKILGTEEFLLSAPGGAMPARSNGEELLAGRSQWITLLCEVLPRALLAEFGLARILLGSSGGGQFLLVLPGEDREKAEEFLTVAARQLGELSGGHLTLLWSVTENLGDWSVVRRRLNDELQHKRATPLATQGAAAFQPVAAPAPSDADTYFSKELGLNVREASAIGWSPETPAMVHPGTGKYTWNVTPNLSLDGITLARHAAPSEDGRSAATVATLARRAQGRSLWGVLRGDVDNFGVRLRRVTTIEEHVQLSVLYKQFFAGELEVLCSMPEFWRKVSILYSGGDDFAVYGSWDALLLLAREVQRLFHRFTEENLKDYPGPEGKTISMAMALAPEMHYPIAAVYRGCRAQPGTGQGRGQGLHLRAGPYPRMEAAGRRRGPERHGGKAGRRFPACRGSSSWDCAVFTRSRPLAMARKTKGRLRTWRFQRRLNRILSGTRDREFQKLRTHLTNEIVGRKSAEVKLRPAGLVALEWARLATEV